MTSVRTVLLLLVSACLVVLVGGLLVASGIRDQHSARGDLNELRVANGNLELVMQARIDEVLDQQSLAFTGAADDDLREHVDYLRELAPDDSADGLGRLAALDDDLQRERTPNLISVSLALDGIADDTQGPVIERLEAAETRTWWALVLTGGLTLVLLVGALARLGRTARS